MKSVKFFLSGLVLAGLLGCGSPKTPEPAAPGGGNTGETATTTTAAKAPEAGQIRIAVIPKGTTHPFWKTVHAGAAKAAKELNVKIDWVGAENEDDRAQQIALVQNFISKNVNAIVLAPLDDTALVRPVEEAIRRNIPVVIIDSDLKTDKKQSFVATDNREGGRVGARRLGAAMDAMGNAIMLRYAEGSESTRQREEGFLEEMAKKYPKIQFLSTNIYGGVTKESAMQAATDLLTKFPNVQGIFCPNESSAFGMMRALETTGKAGKVRFVGFDTSAGLLEGMKKGGIDGLVSQDPFDMGYKGVKTAYDVIQGKTVEKRIATRLLMVTPDNMNKKEVKEVTEPEVDKWLQ